MDSDADEAAAPLKGAEYWLVIRKEFLVRMESILARLESAQPVSVEERLPVGQPPSALEIIDHPRNDAEAVEIIRQSKEKI